MAAGQGFKTFTTGEVLTAGDVNGYLMQGVLVFASAAARNAAITSPQEGQFAYTKDTNGLWYYDGAAWVASGATGDIEGVTAGVGISGGGTSGTVTITNSMATAIDAKGDLVPGTGADTFARLAVGANDTVLTADSTTATGLKWAVPGSGALKLIAAQAIGTGVSSVTVTNAFSTNYDGYKVFLIGSTSSVASGNAIKIQLGAATTAYYYGGCFTSYNSTASGIGGSNVDGWIAGALENPASSLEMEIFQPYQALPTYFSANNTFPASRAGRIDGCQNSNTSFTDLKISPQAGTFTGGTLYVYGYAKV